MKDIIGKPYRETDEDGNYMGCLEPMYWAMPDMPRYPLPEGDFNRFLIKKFGEHCKRVSIDKIQKNDIILCKIGNILHIALYLGNKEILEVCKDNVVMHNIIDLQDEIIKGVYRWV